MLRLTGLLLELAGCPLLQGLWPVLAGLQYKGGLIFLDACKVGPKVTPPAPEPCTNLELWP